MARMMRRWLALSVRTSTKALGSHFLSLSPSGPCAARRSDIKELWHHLLRSHLACSAALSLPDLEEECQDLLGTVSYVQTPYLLESTCCQLVVTS